MNRAHLVVVAMLLAPPPVIAQEQVAPARTPAEVPLDDWVMCKAPSLLAAWYRADQINRDGAGDANLFMFMDQDFFESSSTYFSHCRKICPLLDRAEDTFESLTRTALAAGFVPDSTRNPLPAIREHVPAEAWDEYLGQLRGAALDCTNEGRSSEEQVQLFELFSYCSPLDMVVEDLNSDAVDMGLEKTALERTIRSRLRAARVYASEESASVTPFLYLNVNFVGRAFSIDLEFRKRVQEDVSNTRFHATTWSVGSAGTHGGDPGFILQGVSEHMDQFIDEYLAVNERACEYTR